MEGDIMLSCQTAQIPDDLCLLTDDIVRETQRGKCGPAVRANDH